jgi:hypothetical protein
MNHQELCERAKLWLRGTRRCNPVFSNCASCGEIPDAIGWASAYKWEGSTVIECKVSVSDFYADKSKRLGFKDPKTGHIYTSTWWGRKAAKAQGYEEVELPMMGDYRFYLCEPRIISVELVEKHAPDHGLIYRDGRAMRIVRPAPKRENVDKDSEIRYLRFAIINGKNPFSVPEKQPQQSEMALR